MRNVSVFAVAITLIILSCNPNKPEQPGPAKQVIPAITTADKDLLQKAQAIFKPLPASDTVNNYDLAANRIKLGKLLYFDTRLSKRGNINCNSCHNLSTYGTDNLPFSKGDAGNLGGRSSPTVLNSALQIAQFWDGRAKDVEEQAGMPILNPVEMEMPNEAAVIQRLSKDNEYKKLFKEAFPKDKNPITYVNLGKSIGAFERTLLTPSRFDNYLKGDITALSAEERAGLNTFLDAGCASCHQGVGVGGGMFQKFGVYADYRTVLPQGIKEDIGRKAVTKNDADKDVFKVPMLRNITKTGPYFHNGSVKDLSEAIRIMGQIQLNKKLSNDEIKSIAIFLNTLTGELPESVKQAP